MNFYFTSIDRHSSLSISGTWIQESLCQLHVKNPSRRGQLGFYKLLNHETEYRAGDSLRSTLCLNFDVVLQNSMNLKHFTIPKSAGDLEHKNYIQ